MSFSCADRSALLSERSPNSQGPPQLRYQLLYEWRPRTTNNPAISPNFVDAPKCSRVRFGKKFSKIQFSVLVLIPFLLPLYIWWNVENELSLLITIFALPISLHLINQIFSLTGSDLNHVLARTARYLFIFMLLLSAGLVL